MGKGAGGVLGHGDEKDLEYPKQIETLATSKVIKIVASSDQSGCLTDKKMLLFWGNNGYDPPQLKPRLHPKSLVKDEKQKVKDVKLGESHTIILTESNNVMTWGRNEKGCLGRLNVEKGWYERDAEDPILSGIEGIASGRFSSVAWSKLISYFFLFLILHLFGNSDSSNLYFWGDSIGEIEIKYTPFNILFNSPIKSVEFGDNHFLILTKSNFIYCIGDNKFGQSTGIPSVESIKVIKLFLIDNKFDEEQKKKSWLKKSTPSFEITKSQTPSKLEASILKKSQKDTDILKNCSWESIHANGITSFAINSKKKTFLNFIFLICLLFQSEKGEIYVWGEQLKTPLYLSSVNKKSLSVVYFNSTIANIIDTESKETIKFNTVSKAKK